MSRSFSKIYFLKKELGPFLSSRNLVITLRDGILKDAPSKAVLNFRGVVFTSRAFCDEFSKMSKFLTKKGIKIDLREVPLIVDFFLRKIAANTLRKHEAQPKSKNFSPRHS